MYKNENNRTRTKTQPGQNTKKKIWIEDDVNLTRSGLFDTGYEVLDDATSSEGR